MLRRILCAAAAAAALGLSGAPAAAAPPSAADFGKAAAISSVDLSPDGRHIAAVVSSDGVKTQIAIWRMEKPDQPLALINVHPQQRAVGVRFLKNDRLAVVTQQMIDYSLGGGLTRTHLRKTMITDLAGKLEMPLLPERRQREGITESVRMMVDPIILDSLPADPQHVLVQNTRLDGEGDVYKLNVYTGAAERVYRGSERWSSEQADVTGDVRARQSIDYDNGRVYLAQWIKHPDTGAWQEHFRWYAADREPMYIVGFDKDDRNIAYVGTNKGRDKTAIYDYDIRQRKLLEPLFEHRMFDALGVIQSDAKGEVGRVLGFWYGAEVSRPHWIDGRLKAIDAGLRQALGIKTTPVQWTDPASGQTLAYRTADGADVRLADWSDDYKHVLVEKSGPKQPPEYFLLTDGALTPLAKSRPWIDVSTLGDTRLVQYKARDGLVIPAFLTTPSKALHGPGPYPAILVPHGGPWSRDSMDWDDTGWTQYFAARGYAVLQPQFRGSDGWGQKLWRAGDAEWGQKMQDDKDDGAKWLIEQKIAAPDRIAMHGYSYGGYAAMAAAVRPNGLYQCAIAGAGVAELVSFRAETWEDKLVREFQRPTIKGLEPLQVASRAKIPVMLYHGDRDDNVPIKQSRMFRDRLKGAGLPHRYVEYKDMGHPFVTWADNQPAQVLSGIEDFLKRDCGPGGL